MEHRATCDRFLTVEARASLYQQERWLLTLGGAVLLGTLALAQVGAAQVPPQEAPTPTEVTMLTDNPNGSDPELAPDAASGEAPVAGPVTLTGQVLIGPTCPVVRLDRLDQCQDRPYPARVSIQTADGTSEVTQVTTDDQGRFLIDLDPGTYLIVPLTLPGHILPRGIPQPVTLDPGVVSTVIVHYDSGIR